MEKKYKGALFFNTAIVLIGFVTELLNLPHLADLPDGGLATVSHLVMYLLIFCYAAFAYRKPHGNMLKYLMLLFSVCLFTNIRHAANVSNTPGFVSLFLAVTSVSHMAGRLHKIEKNRYVSVWVLVLLLIAAVSDLLAIPESSDFLSTLRLFTNAILWIALATAYFTRFLAHKEAGLMDKSKEN